MLPFHFDILFIHLLTFKILEKLGVGTEHLDQRGLS